MPTLKDALTDEAKRQAVVDDCCDIIDHEVADKGGVSGLAIKAGYKAVQGVRPGFVRQAVTDLIPEFADALENLYQEATQAGRSFSEFFGNRAPDVAEALLAITDDKAQRAERQVIKATYKRLRPAAKKNVQAAVPRISQLIEKHASP